MTWEQRFKEDFSPYGFLHPLNIRVKVLIVSKIKEDIKKYAYEFLYFQVILADWNRSKSPWVQRVILSSFKVSVGETVNVWYTVM